MNTWNIDQAHSEVGFRVKHLMVSTVRGYFGTFSGTVTAADDTMNDAMLTFEAEVASIHTNNTQRDSHLQSADFFDSAQFPKVMFVSKSFKKAGDTFSVTGDFTMKGVTKEITLNAVFNGIATDAYGKRVAAFDVSGTINRSDFGIKWNAPLDKGGVTISEKVMLDATIELKEA